MKGSTQVPIVERLLAVATLIVISPLLVIVAGAVLVGSGRPALYRADRLGKHATPFQLFKFRTMRKSAIGARVTVSGDDRVTCVGRFLRATKLDELPQLLNVVRGDIRLVGPRPEDPVFVDLDNPEEQALLAIFPGITGAASVEFRHEETFLGERVAAGASVHESYAAAQEAKRRLDLTYELTRTWRTDVSLLMATFGRLWSTADDQVVGPLSELGVSVDKQQLDQTYREYRGAYAERWSAENEGNRAISEERERLINEMVGMVAADSVVLDVGAGAGGSFPGVAVGARRIAFDILEWRLRESASDLGVVPAVCGDGCALPFLSGSVDLVFLSTVLSSIDADTGASIISEAQRVVRRGGHVIVYDFRVPNPNNATTRPIRRRWLVAQLDRCDVTARSLTVVPQLARRLGGRAHERYPRLSRLRFMRTHLLVVGHRD